MATIAAIITINHATDSVTTIATHSACYNHIVRGPDRIRKLEFNFEILSLHTLYTTISPTCLTMLEGRLIVSGMIYWSRCVEGPISVGMMYIGC